MLLFILNSNITYSQHWKKVKTPPINDRIVHAMTSNNTGTYILEGRLMTGERSDQLVLINRKNEVSSFKGSDARDGHSLSVGKDENLISFGGVNKDRFSNDLWLYKNNKWELVIPKNGKKPAPRWGHAAVYFNNTLWVFGGKAQGKGNFHQDLWSWDGTVWKEHSSTVKPKGRYGVQLGVYNNKLVLYGGRNHSGDWFTDTWIWDKEWKQLNLKKGIQKPNTSVGFSLITANNQLFLIGGILKGNSYKKMWSFKGDRWELKHASLPFQLDFPAGCYDSKENSLLLSGSNKGVFQIWKYLLN